jgi:hypothetical protein
MGATASNIARAGDAGAGKRRATGLLFALAATAVLLVLLWNFRGYLTGGDEGDALARDLDMQIAQAETRNKVLEAEIARRHGKGAPVKCVPESKK